MFLIYPVVPSPPVFWAGWGFIGKKKFFLKTVFCSALFQWMLRSTFRLGSDYDALEIRDYVLMCLCLGVGVSVLGLQTPAPPGGEVSLAAEAAALSTIRTIQRHS